MQQIKNILTRIVLILVFTLPAMCWAKTLTVEGQLKNLAQQKISISFQDSNGKRHQASSITDDQGHFKMSVVSQEEPVVGRLGFTKETTADGKPYTRDRTFRKAVIVIHQSNLTVSGDANNVFNISITGDIENNDLTLSRKLLQNFNNKDEKLFLEFISLNDAEKRAEVLKTMKANNAQKQVTQKKFINDNLGSFASLYLLSIMERNYTTDDYADTYETLSAEYKQTMLAKKIEKAIAPNIATRRGVEAMNFKRTSLDGKTIELSDLKGQVVLLDFWGSWCKACRASHPHLKELYKKYHEKGFEILAVAKEYKKNLADCRKEWKRAVEEDDIHWMHVLDNEELDGKKICKDYNIKAFPTKLLIDKDGKIIMRLTGGAANDIDIKLKEIFGY